MVNCKFLVVVLLFLFQFLIRLLDFIDCTIKWNGVGPDHIGYSPRVWVQIFLGEDSVVSIGQKSRRWLIWLQRESQL